MDVKFFTDIANSYGIFCALFIAMLIWQLKTNHDALKRYEAREEKIIDRFQAREESMKNEAKEDKAEFLKTLEGYKQELESLLRSHEKFEKELKNLSDLIDKLLNRIDNKHR